MLRIGGLIFPVYNLRRESYRKGEKMKKAHRTLVYNRNAPLPFSFVKFSTGSPTGMFLSFIWCH